MIIILMGSNCQFSLNAALCFHGVFIYEESLWKIHFMKRETSQPQNIADLLFL